MALTTPKTKAPPQPRSAGRRKSGAKPAPVRPALRAVSAPRPIEFKVKDLSLAEWGRKARCT